ncbi:MAG: rhodanese-like domain-containing protein [Candidatus Poribacteria bacterium]|nr:rhodanese-like domain-containing protein [Candidatus Poribacteria bacterium]
MNDKGYVNPQLLISTEELMSKRDDSSICLVDTRPTHEYVKGHIPGAIHLDLYSISLNDTSEKPFQAFMWMIAYLFQHRGVDPTKTIVWYENNSGIRASRGLWFCEYFGHEDVRVLDGGFSAWLAAGGEVSTEAVEPLEAPSFSTEAQSATHIDADAIHALLNQDDFVVLDTRTAAEHYGYAVRAARGGAIPGSIHIEWLNNLDENGAFKPANELRALYESTGITPEKRVMCY